MSRLNDLLRLAGERAEAMGLPYNGALTPKEAAEVLSLDTQARLVDVRTKAEWDWVGRVPHAVEISWQGYPGSVPNEHFLQELKHALTSENTLLFMCRSGVRSNAAATAAAAAGFPACYNVLEGFEGDKDGKGHRNSINGWRFNGLPWIQG